jgi:signal transduction histidine kinase
MQLIPEKQSLSSALGSTIRLLVIDARVENEFTNIRSHEETGINGISRNESLQDELFGKRFFSLYQESASLAGQFQIDSVSRSSDGYDKAVAAVEAGRPYSLAFFDMRRHLGWGRFKDIERLWNVDPHIQVVVCTDTYDHPWERILGRLGNRDNLLIITEPFAPIAVMQVTKALIRKRQLAAEVRLTQTELEYMVQARTHELSFTRDVLQEANRALMDAKLEAQRATIAKSEFLLNLSREMRAPIDAMLDVTRRLQENDLSVEQRRFIESIAAAGRSLLMIIDEALEALPQDSATMSRVA